MKKVLLILLFFISSIFAFEDLTKDNFDEKIANKNVVVDFYSTYWGSCKILGKNLTNYSTSTKPQNVEIYKLEVSQQSEISKKYEAYAVPMLIYFKNGKEIAREMGVKSPEEIDENVKKHLLN